MRYRKAGVVIFLIGMLMLMLPFSASAEIDSPFQTEPADSYPIEMAFYDLRLQYKTEEYTGDGDISSFDVNQDNEIITNIRSSASHYYINYYQNNRAFSHCIVVNPVSQGAVVALFDQTDGHLLLYDVRKKLLYKIDENGDCIEVEKTTEKFNVSPVINSVRSKSETTVNGVQYSLNDKDVPMKTPTITMTLPNGETQTIYKQTGRNFFRRFMIFIAMIGIVAVNGLVIWKRNKKPQINK